jgi:hypothetical protein
MFYADDVINQIQKIKDKNGKISFTSHFSMPLNEDIFGIFGRFIEDYIRNLTCWKKYENRFGLSALKLSKNHRFFLKTKSCWEVLLIYQKFIE